MHSWLSYRNLRRYRTKISVCSKRFACRRSACAPVVEGETPRSAFVLTRGMACRFRLMPDGRRQILNILLPGDFFDLHGFLLKAMDHSVAAIGPTRIAAIGREAVIDIIA